MKAFYDSIGGSYAEAVGRMMRDSLVRKFVLKFRNDPSFAALSAALEGKDWDGAFSAAHTLKGVAMNLAFTRLSASASALTDALRPQNRPALDEGELRKLYAAVERDYREVMEKEIP